MIVGKIALLRSDNKSISYTLCDNNKDEDLASSILYIEKPIIKEAIKNYSGNIKRFTLLKYSYSIVSLQLDRTILKRNEEKNKVIFLKKTAVIHIVSQQSFGDINFHCPSCRSEGSNVVDVVTVMLEKLSNNKIRIPFQGVLNCKKCGYFFANKHMFEEFLEKNKYDIVAPRKEIKIKNSNIFYSAGWNGASDSPLSRYGYSADGTLGDKKRREVIQYLIANKITDIHTIQNLLSGFLRGRKNRNPPCSRNMAIRP